MEKPTLDQILWATKGLPSLSEAEDSLMLAKGWEERYKRLLDLGKHLQDLPVTWRDDAVRIKGCQSGAWLWSADNDGRRYFWGDSESKLVRALLALCLCKWNGVPVDELHSIDPAPWLAQFRLERHLSSSRMGGLAALALAMRGKQ